MSKDMNLFEHDYIIEALELFASDLQRGKMLPMIIDKHACIITAFMQGQLTESKGEITRLTAMLKDAQRETARGAIAIIEGFDHVSRLGGIITANDIIAAIKERYQI